MKQPYSLKKGAVKALVSLLSIAGALVAFAGFSDLGLWSLVETYVKPLLGSLTVGAVIVFGINWLKNKA